MNLQLSMLLRAFVVAAVTLCSAASVVHATPLQTAPDQLPGAGTVAPLPPGVNAALDSAREVRGRTLQISVITYGPTDDVTERFGHDAIAVRDTVTGQDVAYNWGVYGFDQPHFYTRFLTGDTNYWMAAYPTLDFNQYYVQHNRTVRVQRLALTSVERAALLEFVVWNASEANKYYRYDYYQDNCATRVRDALNRVLKGRLKIALDSGKTPYTWRSETERVTASNLPVYSGIELALGQNADRRLTPWAASFMPERLAEALVPVVLRTETGARYSLVAHDSVLFASTRVPMPIDPPERLAMAALLGLTLAGIIALMTDSRFRVVRGLLIVFATLWYTIGGILGFALLLAGTATKHAPYMGSNITLWQIHPLLLIAALFVPMALKRRQASIAPRAVVALIVLFSAFGALLQLIPMFSQHSGAVVAVVLPVHLALAIAVLRTPPVSPVRGANKAALSRAA